MTKRRKQRDGLSAVEVIITVVVCSGLLVILLPALVSSRELARENLCRRNLRRMYLAAKENGSAIARATTAKNTNGDSQKRAWTIVLLSELNIEAKLNEPRPHTLTCPSRPLDNDLPPAEQISHYMATVAIGSNFNVAWAFRDRELEIPPSRRRPWYDAALELVPELQPPKLKQGPHTDGSYLYTTEDGSIQSLKLLPATDDLDDAT